MLERLPEGRNTYSIATANHLDTATVGQTMRRVSSQVDIATSAGYDGVELWPQGIIPRVELKLGNISGKDKVTSLHQSPRGPIVDRRGAMAAFFLPEVNDSLRHLERMGEIVGDVPVVLIDPVPEDYLSDSRFSFKQIQTAPETARRWGANKDGSVWNAHDYLEKSRERGFQGLVIDTHHIRRADSETNDPNPLAYWQNTVPILLEGCKEIHVGVGRTDYGKLDRDLIIEETKDLLNGGDRDTPVIQMLRYIANTGWNGLVVVEARPTEIYKILGKNPLLKAAWSLLHDQTLINAYSDIRETFYRIFGN